MRDLEENGQVLYSVSEAVQRSGVPSHVLRYWEDELGLSIRRTAQGHRVYSEEDLDTFLRVKELKEKGIQLKAIRLLFEDTQEGRQISQLFGQETYGRQEEGSMGRLLYRRGEDSAGACKTDASDTQEEFRREHPDPESKVNPAGGLESEGEAEYEIIPKAETGTYRLFETMLRSLINEAVAGQNEKLEAEIADLIREELEELYIQLRQDAGEREAAAAQMSGTGAHDREGPLRRLRRLLRNRAG